MGGIKLLPESVFTGGSSRRAAGSGDPEDDWRYEDPALKYPLEHI